MTFANLSSISRRRWRNFRANGRGFWSLWILLGLFALSLCAELVANDRPLMVRYQGKTFFPVVKTYPETAFGGTFETSADYRDPFLKELITKDGSIIWPAIEFAPGTINYDLKTPPPAAPSAVNWLGTDEQGRDVAARLLYGFRISILFGLALTVISSVFGIAAGAVQGYFGGLLDLAMQRIIEVWSGLPQLFILVIVSSVVVPSFWTLLGVMLLFSWTTLINLVRAEFLRSRNFDYVRAARALGMGDFQIIVKHILPNSMVATITFLPFVLAGAVTALTSLDFLGLGLPPGTPSLGELLRQGKEYLHAPWLGITGFVAVALLLTLMIFVGEAVRDAFDPRKTFAAGDEP